MKKFILDYICRLEGFKTACQNIHWSSRNMSQHKLFDEISESIRKHQDDISEVAQGIDGNRLSFNTLNGIAYKIETPAKFIEDMLKCTMGFYSKLEKLGNEYVGMKSDVEAYISELQKYQYLLDFTVKEELKRRLKNRLNENVYSISKGGVEFNLTENQLKEMITKSIKNILG